MPQGGLRLGEIDAMPLAARNAGGKHDMNHGQGFGERRHDRSRERMQRDR
jgi:hypothetical protein